MPVDNDNIKKALDDFENDDFLSAKDAIKKEISGTVRDFFKEKLDLQKDLDTTTKQPDTETDTKTDTETGTKADDDAGGGTKD